MGAGGVHPPGRSPERTSTERTARSGDLGLRFQQALEVTLSAYEGSLRQHMPAGAYRDFCLWALSSQNSQRPLYLRVMGITQLVRLTVTLLDGVVDDPGWRRLLDYVGPLNAYLTYEAVSDNLAIGLAGLAVKDPTYALRRELLHAFNHAMTRRLDGEAIEAACLLDPMRPVAQRISLFDQSLARTSHLALAQAYLEQRSGLSLGELDHAVWPPLIANIEACADLARSTSDCQIGHLVRKGLCRRYEAVDRLLTVEPLTLSQLAELGAYAILVIPTLAYYVAILAEMIASCAGLRRAIEDGTLERALYDAALLVRLLNDLGTRLLVFADEREELLSYLQECYQANGEAPQTFTDLMPHVDGKFSLLTRIRKDVSFGEFNVALYNVRELRPVPDALQAFEANLDYFAQLYACHHARLLDEASILDECLGHDQISQLILRFVRFHEMLYSNPYHTSAGEYAI